MAEDTRPDAEPIVPLSLVQYLKRKLPLESPSMSDSIETIRFKSGQQDVIAWLARMHEDQNSPDIERTLADV